MIKAAHLDLVTDASTIPNFNFHEDEHDIENVHLKGDIHWSLIFKTRDDEPKNSNASVEVEFGKTIDLELSYTKCETGEVVTKPICLKDIKVTMEPGRFLREYGVNGKKLDLDLTIREIYWTEKSTRIVVSCGYNE